MFEIDRLVTCLPQPELYAERLKAQLEGVHKFTRQVGDRSLEVELTIHQVDVQPEGIGAIAHALKHEVIKPGTDGYVAFFDLGRNTAIYWLVDMMGDRQK